MVAEGRRRLCLRQRRPELGNRLGICKSRVEVATETREEL